MANGNKIITYTKSKTMIRHGELVRILNAAEIQQWHNLLEKIRVFEEREKERTGK